MAYEDDAIQSLFYPRGTAVIGSASQGKLGYELIRQMVEGGYERVFAVNPKAEGALAVGGYDAVTKIEEPVDLAVIASPPATVPSVLEDCGRAGVRAAAIVTAGFSEIGNREAEQEVSRIAAEHGIRFVGPNCAGVVNTGHALYPTLETRPPQGSAAVVAQSGAIGGIVLAWAKAFGLGISKFVSYGNGADLNEIDFLSYLAEDGETKVVGLYIESTSDGRKLMEAVRDCTRRKPVVVIKAGRTEAGQRATLSHTGSMAGADAVYDAALEQCGAIRVDSVEEMFDFCKAYTGLPAVSRIIRGDGETRPRIAIVTNSGGPGVLAADRAAEVGLDVAEPSAAVQQALQGFLPEHCAVRNPIDLTVEGTEEWYRRTLGAIMGEYDAALALNVATPYLDSIALARGVTDASETSEAAVVAAFLPERIVAESVEYLQGRGVPNFATGERAAAALGAIGQYDPGRGHGAEIPTQRGRGRLPDEGEMLEPTAMAWLAENGIPVPQLRFARSRDEAAEACGEIGYPVAIKIVSPEILHKSDVGGVILDVRDDDEARRAFEELERIGSGRDFRGVVIYPMVRGGQEVLMGLTRDPQFGPIVAIGLGGIYAEVWEDIALRVAPVDRAEAGKMIRGLASFPILEGVRGESKRDLDALTGALVRVSQLPFEYPGIEEVDLNPVFVFEEGAGLVVGDVRVIVGRASEERH